MGFPYHFKKIIVRYKKIGCNIDILLQTACLVVNSIKGNNFTYLFDCRSGIRLNDMYHPYPNFKVTWAVGD